MLLIFPASSVGSNSNLSHYWFRPVLIATSSKFAAM